MFEVNWKLIRRRCPICFSLSLTYEEDSIVRQLEAEAYRPSHSGLSRKVEEEFLASISFWGGVGTVTGSKYLVETERARVLVDCGMFQGLKELRERNWQDPPFDPRSLAAVLITHAPIDPTGFLPR